MLFVESGTGEPATFRLIDFMGRTLMLYESENGEGFFQIKGLQRGMYVVEAHGKNLHQCQKVVVE
ncbi:MAG: T9SS type A sorting domain-containing protein [Lewinellaceae bacterium]|nr:T9SS type A sorting domain-containing protein [Lewinellaceae bacterium]